MGELFLPHTMPLNRVIRTSSGILIGAPIPCCCVSVKYIAVFSASCVICITSVFGNFEQISFVGILIFISKYFVFHLSIEKSWGMINLIS